MGAEDESPQGTEAVKERKENEKMDSDPNPRRDDDNQKDATEVEKDDKENDKMDSDAMQLKPDEESNNDSTELGKEDKENDQMDSVANQLKDVDDAKDSTEIDKDTDNGTMDSNQLADGANGTSGGMDLDD